MKKAIAIPIQFLILFVIAIIAVLFSAGAGKGAIDSGSRQTDAASSSTISMSGGPQCDTFCGGTIALPLEDAKKRFCASVKCNANSNTYTFTCTEDATRTKCVEMCKANVPTECEADCTGPPPVIGITAYEDCPKHLELSAAMGGGSCTVRDMPACPEGTDECSSGSCSPPAGPGKSCCRASSGGGSGGGGGGSGGSGGGGGGSGSSSVILKQIIPPSTSKVTVSTIKPAIETYVELAGSDPTPDSISVRLLRSDGTEALCGVPSSLPCVSKPTATSFLVPSNSLKNGNYWVEVTAIKAAVGATKKVYFSWNCPAIKFDPTSKYEPNGVVAALFESPVIDKRDLAVKINTREYPVDSINIDPLNPSNITFRLPLIGIPSPAPSLRSGSPANKLDVGRYDAGICIKTETVLEGGNPVSRDYVKNEISRSFTWTCPSSGCTIAGGRQYVVSGVLEGSSYTDPSTGCDYSTLGAECTTGCEKGTCKEAKLKITTVKLDNVVVGSGKIYENFANDRIFSVTVENTGTLTATAVDDNSRTTAKLDTTALGLMLGPTNIGSLQSGVYQFQLSRGVPAVPLGKMSVVKTLYLTAQGSNTPSVSKTLALTFYKCGAACSTYDNAALCNSCNDAYGCAWKSKCTGPGSCSSHSTAASCAAASGCTWDPNFNEYCAYKCWVTSNACNNFITKEDCDACAPCVWNSADPTPCNIDPIHVIPA